MLHASHTPIASLIRVDEKFFSLSKIYCNFLPKKA
jgi:hypothetical protein